MGLVRSFDKKRTIQYCLAPGTTTIRENHCYTVFKLFL